MMKKLFDEIPYLEDERIIIRKITGRDWRELRKMARSRVIYRYEPTYLLERKYSNSIEFLKGLVRKIRDKENLLLAVEYKEDRKLCGLAEFYDYSERLHRVCIGYRLREEYWGKGIATAAVKLMTDYLQTQTDVEIISASTMPDNKASAHVLEKNGFVLITCDNEDWGYELPTKALKWLL